MTIEVRAVSHFDKVLLRGPGILTISQGDRECLTLQAPRSAIGQLQTVVVDGELQLGCVPQQAPGTIIPLQLHREVITYDLQVRSLARLRLTGTGRAVLPDMDTDRLLVQVLGGGQIRLEHLTADHLEVLIDGRGKVRVNGDVETQQVCVRGAGDYHALALTCDFADLRVTDAGRAAVAVNEILNVVISGHGAVSYVGNPDITQVISGPGQLQRRKSTGRAPKRGEEHG